MSLMNLAQFDENDAGNSNTPLPKGDYPLALLEWEQKQTAKGMGLKVQFVVLDGQYKDRRVFEFFNTQHPNADAVRISGAMLKQIVIAAGFDGNQDLTEQLMDACVGKPFVGAVGIQKAKPGDQYGDSNRLQKAMSNAAYTAKPPAPQAAPTAPVAPVAAAPVAPQYAPAPAAPVAAPPAAPAAPAEVPPFLQQQAS